jgi:tetratricopeptide (TPR) repeat protein
MISPRENDGTDPRDFDPRALLRWMERQLNHPPPRATKADRAQQLVYDAWEAPTADEEFDLMRKALELDPTNVDALLYMLPLAEREVEEEIQSLRNVVALGEKGLGPKRFKEFAGSFWGFIETRPYMRARQMLAETLRAAGRLEEAISEYEGMLALNPNDNQGVRYHLLPCYLATNRFEQAEALLAKYEECEHNAVFAWARVLVFFCREDLGGARKALAAARKQNSHVQGYIKGHRRLPPALPAGYSPGSREEAICFAEVLRAAWERHPKALAWLAAQKVE